MDSAQVPQQWHELVRTWNEEHEDLARHITETTQWLAAVSDLGIPRFGELGERLKQLRERLKRHFALEDRLSQQMQASDDCVELATSRRRSLGEHEHLLRRIDVLVERLGELDPPFESFQQAIEEVSLLVDAFEQHEEDEAQGLQWWTGGADRGQSPSVPR